VSLTTISRFDASALRIERLTAARGHALRVCR
jgi:hypothetical protein